MCADPSRKPFNSPTFDPAWLLAEQVKERIQGLNRTVLHTMRLASDNRLMRHVPKTSQTRFVPCAWGVHRDDYSWDAGGGRRDVSAFRIVAAGMAQILLAYPVGAWRSLMPGNMHHVMAARSNLYLADYWVLTLHYLVWAKKLPYAIDAYWKQGSCIRDERFYFVSEMPVDLVEASVDAVMLFQEAAVRERMEDEASWNEPDDTEYDGPPSEPPIYHDGRWRLSPQLESTSASEPATPETREPPVSPASEQDATSETSSGDVDENENPDEPSDSDTADLNESEIEDDTPYPTLELDDQSFTVRFGNQFYRFTGRNKQLFALLERIDRRPGMRVTFDVLRSAGDVWDGSPVEDSTIRGAVTRLRKLLRKNGMGRLADRIKTGTYRGSGFVMLNVGDE